MADGKEKSVHVGLVLSSTTKHFHSSATDLLPLTDENKAAVCPVVRSLWLGTIFVFQDSK